MRMVLVLAVLCGCGNRRDVDDDGGGAQDGGRFGALAPDLDPPALDSSSADLDGVSRCGSWTQACCTGDVCSDTTTTCVYFVFPQPGDPVNWCERCGGFGQPPCKGANGSGGTRVYCLDGVPLPVKSSYCGCGDPNQVCCPSPDMPCHDGDSCQGGSCL